MSEDLFLIYPYSPSLTHTLFLSPTLSHHLHTHTTQMLLIQCCLILLSLIPYLIIATDISDYQSRYGIPTFPRETAIAIHGRYPYAGYQVQGYIYISTAQNKWRFDTVLGWDTNIVQNQGTQGTIMEFDFTTSPDGLTVSTYHMDPVRFYWTCDAVRLNGRITSNLLQSARISGVETVNNRKAVVYVNTSIWPGGNLLTYVDIQTNRILRQKWDIGAGSLVYDVDSITDLGNNYNWGNAFQIPAGLRNVPCQ